MKLVWLELLLLCTLPPIAIWSAISIFKSAILSRNRKMEARADRWHNDEYNAWCKVIRAQGRLNPVSCPMTLEPGERCFSYDSSVALYVPFEPHEHHGEEVVFDTPFGQPIGGDWSILDCFDSVQFIGRGRLCITDRNISFGDCLQMQAVSLNDVHTVAASSSCLLIGAVRMDRPMLFNGVNGQRLRDIIHLLLKEV